LGGPLEAFPLLLKGGEGKREKRGLRAGIRGLGIAEVEFGI